MVSGAPTSPRPSKSTFLTLCCATASSISRKVRLASSNENTPAARTLKRPDSGPISSFMLILTRATPCDSMPQKQSIVLACGNQSSYRFQVRPKRVCQLPVNHERGDSVAIDQTKKISERGAVAAVAHEPRWPGELRPGKKT